MRFTSKIFIVCRERQGQERIAQRQRAVAPDIEKNISKSINEGGRYGMNDVSKSQRKGERRQKVL